VPDGIAIAAALTEGRLDPGWVDRVQAAVGEERLTAGLRYVAACASARVVLGELEESTTRIADLVGAVRDYSYLDQGPRQTVDIHEGIESTLKLLAHKLGDSRVEIVRDFDPGLPTVEASGSELNQVWTNLIDNALDAVGDAGQITLRTRPQGLDIAQRIVVRNRGELRLESRPGDTRFQVLLPTG
jgi:nitrogen-specific signal transduction histidine kinase